MSAAAPGSPFRSKGWAPAGACRVARPLAGALFLLIGLAVVTGHGQEAVAPAAMPGEGREPRCVSAARAARADCVIEQRLSLEGTGQAFVTVSVRVPAEPRNPVLMVSAPLGLYLPAGLRLRVDDGEAHRLEIQGCDNNGCHVAAPLPRLCSPPYGRARPCTRPWRAWHARPSTSMCPWRALPAASAASSDAAPGNRTQTTAAPAAAKCRPMRPVAAGRGDAAPATPRSGSGGPRARARGRREGPRLHVGSRAGRGAERRFDAIAQPDPRRLEPPGLGPQRNDWLRFERAELDVGPREPWPRPECAVPAPCWPSPAARRGNWRLGAWGSGSSRKGR